MNKILCIGCAALLVLSTAVAAAGSISDITVKGLKVISADVVFANMTVRIGDEFDQQLLDNAFEALFASGYFDDIIFSREGDVLVVDLVERPTIQEITFKGNTLIQEDDIRKELKKIGVVEGEILQRNFLDTTINNIDYFYSQNGRYGTVITTKVENLSDTQVKVMIDIQEVPTSIVAEILFIGNHAFSSNELLAQFELEQRGVLSNIFHSNDYQRAKLSGDLERLQLFYRNRGYADFTIIDTTVSVSTDKKSIYITIVVDEGEHYTIDVIDYRGSLIYPLEEYQQQEFIAVGDDYSAQSISQLEANITEKLGDRGYGNAQVRTNEIKTENRHMTLEIFINPRERVYVRRIIFTGNTTTADTTLRVELLQLEASWFSRSRLNASIKRIRRKPYIEQVSHEIHHIPGVPSQIDIKINIVEAPSGSISGGVQYSTMGGAGLILQYQDSNYLGTGNAVSANMNTASTTKQLSFSYDQPNFGEDRVSLSTSGYINNTDYTDSSTIANYAFNSYGGSLGLGYPVANTVFVNYGFGIDNKDFVLGSAPIQEITALTNVYGNTITELNVYVGVAQNALNRGVFPTSGGMQSFGLKLKVGDRTTPQYATLHYTGTYYVPISKNESWTTKFSTKLTYSGSYGSRKVVPFTANSYVGGYGTLRGYSATSQGVKATNANGSDAGTLGGNILIQQTTELIFPLWVETKSARFSLYHDMANVFVDRCYVVKPSCNPGVRLQELKRTVGLSIIWMTPLAPLGFHFNRAINPGEGDAVSAFEFSLGAVY